LILGELDNRHNLGRLSGLIVTGANLEIRHLNGFQEELPYADISFYEQLQEVILLANDSELGTVYSCFASHFALNSIYGTVKRTMLRKTFGYYTHSLSRSGQIIHAAHSRWGNIPDSELPDEVDVLATGEAGWLYATRTNSGGAKDLLIQGHPEYSEADLWNEYNRDKKLGQSAPEMSDQAEANGDELLSRLLQETLTKEYKLL
jgi:homoserine O-succinyltransferase/O-acetyltransferase